MIKKTLVFLSILDISNIEANGIYTDLLREFIKDNWNVIIFYGTSKTSEHKNNLNANVTLIPVTISRYEKTNIFRKGTALLKFDKAYKKAIKKESIKSIDLLLYATPPITLTRTIEWVKSEFSAITYLLLKDIFPQNAVDMMILSKNNPLYFYFRYLEKKLYRLSDRIGCMSPANIDYLLSHNKKLQDKVDLNPNCIDINRVNYDSLLNKDSIRKKHRIPKNKKIVIYGGNLGVPQNIPFLIEFMEYTYKHRQDVFFVIAGSGTSSDILMKCGLKNLRFVGRLEQNEFEFLVRSCDIGLISLDYRFSIPNFPSRLLSYLSNGLPVLCLVDKVTDIGRIAEQNGFGYSALNGDLQSSFKALTSLLNDSEFMNMGSLGRSFLISNFSSRNAYMLINRL
jgi:glycosyltransferase involved in cell wall biosynthesis